MIRQSLLSESWGALPPMQPPAAPGWGDMGTPWGTHTHGVAPGPSSQSTRHGKGYLKGNPTGSLPGRLRSAKRYPRGPFLDGS